MENFNKNDYIRWFNTKKKIVRLNYEKQLNNELIIIIIPDKRTLEDIPIIAELFGVGVGVEVEVEQRGRTLLENAPCTFPAG